MKKQIFTPTEENKKCLDLFNKRNQKTNVINEALKIYFDAHGGYEELRK